MTELFVNYISNDTGSSFGICTSEKCLSKNMNIIFDEQGRQDLENGIKNNSKDGFHSFGSFCQFVIYLNYVPFLGITLKFIDFKYDNDIALDEYLSLKEHGWAKSDRDKIMQEFFKIKNTKHDLAKLVFEPIS